MGGVSGQSASAHCTHGTLLSALDHYTFVMFMFGFDHEAEQEDVQRVGGSHDLLLYAGREKVDIVTKMHLSCPLAVLTRQHLWPGISLASRFPCSLVKTKSRSGSVSEKKDSL